MADVEIDPRTVPELAVVLRANMLSKVRLLDVACGADHRLVEVLRLKRRPFALGVDTTMIHGPMRQRSGTGSPPEMAGR
jgi:hypothetical protein